MRIRLSLSLLTAALSWPGVLSAPVANASICSLSSHCYGIAQFSPAFGAYGARAKLRTGCMLVNGTGNFINNEMWVADANRTNWVEAGIKLGKNASGTYNGTDPYYFWADKRPNGQFIGHYFVTTLYPMNSAVTASISATSVPGSWDVSIGPITSTSTSNFTVPSYNMDTGTESTEDLNRSIGTSSTFLEYRTTTNQWVGGWTDGIQSATTFASSGLNAHVNTARTTVTDGQGSTCL